MSWPLTYHIRNIASLVTMNVRNKIFVVCDVFQEINYHLNWGIPAKTHLHFCFSVPPNEVFPLCNRQLGDSRYFNHVSPSCVSVHMRDKNT